MVDLFHGQLKSQVKCKTCGHISARFDPFNFLSLPLPMDSSMHLEITGTESWRTDSRRAISCALAVKLTWLRCGGVASTVIKLDGTTPVRYGLRLNMDEKYTGLKKQLSELCSLKPEQILLAEVHTSNIKVWIRSLLMVPVLPSVLGSLGASLGCRWKRTQKGMDDAFKIPSLLPRLQMFKHANHPRQQLICLQPRTC